MTKKQIIYFIALLAISFEPLVANDDEQPIAPVEVKLGREINYAQDIVPILKKNCVACHNAKTKEGELSLESPDLMRVGGDSGPSIVNGKPEDSFLYLVASRIEEPVMPPLPNKMNAHKLSGQDVWKLRKWIEQGAKGKASTGRSALNWVKPAANLHPIYSLTLTPREDFVVSGLGNQIEIISLTDINNREYLIDPELKSYAHRDFVNAVAVAPSGKFIASAGYRIVKIWERNQPRTLNSNSAGSAIQAASTSGKGQYYCLVNQAGKVIIASDKPGLTWDSGLKKVTAISVNDSGKKVVLATENKLLVVDIPKNEKVELVVPSPVHSLLFQGNNIIAGHADGVIRLWHRPEKSPTYVAQGTELKKHTKAVTKLAIIPGTPLGLLSLSSDGIVVRWDLAAKALKKDWAVGGDAKSIAISPDGKRLISVHQTGRVVVWNEQKKVERDFKSPAALLQQVKLAEENVAIAKSLSTNRQTLLKAADKNVTDRKAALEKAKKALAEATKAFEATKKPQADAKVALDAVKKEIAAAKETPALKKKLDAAQKVFDEKQKTFTAAQEKEKRAKRTITLETASLKRGETEQVQAKKNAEQAAAHLKKSEADLATFKTEVAKNSLKAVGVRFVDAMRLQVLTEQGKLEDWNLATGQPLETESLPGVAKTVQLLPLANNRVCFVDESGTAKLFDMTVSWKLRSRLGPADGKLAVTQSELVNRVTSLAFSPDGKLLATGGGDPSRDGELMLWDWKSAKLVGKIPKAHSDVILSVEFSRDGKQLLTGAADKFVKIFDVATGKLVRSFEGHTEHVLSVAWKADGLSIASASADKTIKIWDTQNGSQKRTISSFGKQVTDLKYIGTSDNLASSCGDKLVRFYQAGNGRNYRNFSGAENYLYSVAVTRGEELVIGAGQNGVVRIWDGKNGKIRHSIKPTE